MINRKLFFVLLVTTITSCGSASDKQPLFDKKNVKQTSDSLSANGDTDNSVHGKKQYTEINEIIKSGDTTFINADYIQFLSGQEAIDAAIKHHQADTFKTQDGKTHIDVPNDYYIVNDNKKIRRLEIDRNCVFDLDIDRNRTHSIKNNSLESLIKIYNDSPFILTLNDKGIVIRIKEVFLP